VAEGILAAAHRGITGRRYILGGHPRTYLEAWRCFARVAEKMQPLGCAHPQITRVFGRIGDLVGMVVGHEMPINSVATEMSMLAHNFSSNRAVTELGYHCRSFETTVIDTWHWFLEHGYARSAKNRPVLAR
jgi:dihydroflavonol-4-reductase